MKVQHLRMVPAAFCAAGLVALSFSAKADTEAVTDVVQANVGFATGGVGFSFTPLTNLAVTRVGYMYMGATSPIISIWSNTNYLIASYPLGTGQEEGQMVYSNISLVLLAGNRYFITLQDGSLAAGNVFSHFASSSGEYQVATQLTIYAGAKVQASGTFGPTPTNLFFLGPNFSFLTYTAPIISPPLEINLSNATAAVISWPESPGFELQKTTSFSAGGWTPVTNTVSVVGGTNRVVISPLTNTAFFRLAYP